MALEYIVGPVLGLLLSMKFTDMKSKEADLKLKKIETQVEQLDLELPKKVMVTMMPVAKAVANINSQLGL
jgi:hypothetical protein